MSSPPARIVTISHDACELGEGPAFDPFGDRLFWLDIAGRRLLEKSWPNGDTQAVDLPEMTSAISPLDDRRQLLVTETGLYLRDAGKGKLSHIMPIEADNGATRSNDARVHPCGAFWIGTMGKNAESGAGAIYWAFRGALRRLYGDITIPNSICFSPDGGTAYFTDTDVNLLYRVSCDPRTGLPTDEPQIFVDHRSGKGGLDGSVVDDEGVVWTACWGAGALVAHGPDGRLLRTISLPASQTTCPAFVGEKADRIVVTSAWEKMDEAARAADPHAGKTFLIDLPVAGRLDPPARFA